MSGNFQQRIKDFSEENPWLKKIALGGAGIFALYLVASSLFSTSENKVLTPEQREAMERRSYLGLEDQLKDIDRGQAQDILQDMRIQLEERERDMDAQRSQSQREIDEMRREQQQLMAQVFEMRNSLEAISNGMQRGGRAQVVGEQVPQGGQYQVSGDPNLYSGDLGPGGNVLRRPQTEIITQAPLIEGNAIRTITQRNVREVEQSGRMSVRDVEVERLTEQSQEVNGNRGGNQQPLSSQGPSRRERAERNRTHTLTMGSIISGTLINGVAAPTRVGSSENPVPILMRVKREAILPNHFSLDIRECMMLGSAIGELASERILIRAERLSCISEDGNAIEQTINAYAVSSSDGLTGIRGTVVERSGEAIMNSVRAGFLSGFANAASPRQVQALNTTPTATSAWEGQNLNRYAGAGMLQGASNAMERIASYYLAIAEAMWPVIEMPAGIEIDFIVQQGMTFDLGEIEDEYYD